MILPQMRHNITRTTQRTYTQSEMWMFFSTEGTELSPRLDLRVLTHQTGLSAVLTMTFYTRQNYTCWCSRSVWHWSMKASVKNLYIIYQKETCTLKKQRRRRLSIEFFFYPLSESLTLEEYMLLTNIEGLSPTENVSFFSFLPQLGSESLWQFLVIKSHCKCNNEPFLEMVSGIWGSH